MTMTNLDQLMPSGPVFDQESLNREILLRKLTEWVAGRRFYTSHLREMREIVNDIAGLSRDVSHASMPTELARLHCMEFESLSPVNLRECLHAALDYVGVTESTGVDLLGVDGWADLKDRVTKATGLPVESASPGDACAVPPSVNKWEQATLAARFSSVFTSPRFYVNHVTDVADALQSFRSEHGLPPHTAPATTIAVLRTLHCERFSEMAAEVRAGIKDAIWAVCGLDARLGRIAFGERWPEIALLDVSEIAEETTAESIAASDSDQPSATATRGPRRRRLPAVAWAASAAVVAAIAFVLALVPPKSKRATPPNLPEAAPLLPEEPAISRAKPSSNF